MNSIKSADCHEISEGLVPHTPYKEMPFLDQATNHFHLNFTFLSPVEGGNPHGVWG
jgi:hypothetical protein